MTRKSQHSSDRTTSPPSTRTVERSVPSKGSVSEARDCLDHIQLGVIGRPHAIRGEMTVWLHNPNSTLLQKLIKAEASSHDGNASIRICAPESALSAETSLRVSSFRSGRKGAWILRSPDVNDRDAAAAFRGWRILVTATSLPALTSDNEFYFHAVEGTSVQLTSGEQLGHIRRVVETSCEVFEIERPDGTELLVPVLHDTVYSFGPPVVLFDHVLEWFDLEHTKSEGDSAARIDVEGGGS